MSVNISVLVNGSGGPGNFVVFANQNTSGLFAIILLVVLWTVGLLLSVRRGYGAVSSFTWPSFACFVLGGAMAFAGWVPFMIPAIFLVLWAIGLWILFV